MSTFKEVIMSIFSDAMYRMSQIFGTTGFIVYVMFAVSATLTFFWTKHWKKLKGLKIAAGVTSLTTGKAN